MAKHQGRLELTWTNKEKTLLSTGDGRYDYTFVDPSDRRVAEVRLLHEVERVEAETPAERPDDLPVPTSGNLLITGDAMHVLDALAKTPEYADKYLGKVKMVYIDPPFNTGQAFINYEDNIEHSIWLTMLRDRLRQIMPLLAPDASVWVHLDDVEVHRCRVVLDEEMGPDNFVAEIAWQKADGLRSDAKGMSISHDTVLVYSSSAKWSPNRTPRTEAQNARFGSPDGDPNPWFDDNPTAPNAITHQGMVYAIQHPITGALIYPTRGRCWWTEQSQVLGHMSAYAEYELRDIADEDKRSEVCGVSTDEVRRGVPALMLVKSLEASAKSAQTAYDDHVWPGIVLRSGGQGGLGRKSYIPTSGFVPDTWWTNKQVGHNREAKAEIKAMFPGTHAFATPKPERLLRRVIQIATNPGDIVLDCFAGSGTTAAVAHKMGRRWVTSELLPETADVFTKPRLAKVVNGKDPGGVTSTVERIAASGVALPVGMSGAEASEFQKALAKVLAEPAQDDEGKDEVPVGGEPLTIPLAKELARKVRAAQKNGDPGLDADEARVFFSLLRKVSRVEDVSTLDITKTVSTQLKARTKTVKAASTTWHGGGGFTHLCVGPSMFEEVEGMVLLADWATNGALTKAMCAQLGVRHRPDGIFAGRHGRTRLVVIDGMVGASTIDMVVDQLLDNETVEIWATQIADDAAERMAQVRPKSRLQRIPDAVLDSYRRKKAHRTPFGGKRNTPASNEGADA